MLRSVNFNCLAAELFFLITNNFNLNILLFHMGNSESDIIANTVFEDVFYQEGARSAAIGGAIGGAVAGIVAGIVIGLCLCCCMRFAASREDDQELRVRNQ